MRRDKFLIFSWTACTYAFIQDLSERSRNLEFENTKDAEPPSHRRLHLCTTVEKFNKNNELFKQPSKA